MSMGKIPEQCKLVAHHAGDGWVLSVELTSLEAQDAGDATVAYLEWPAKWPKRMTTKKLEEYGFETT